MCRNYRPNGVAVTTMDPVLMVVSFGAFVNLYDASPLFSAQFPECVVFMPAACLYSVMLTYSVLV